jgi:cell division protein FtsZ
VKQAITSPLLETTIQGASHVIINISGDISLIEANEAATLVQELSGDSANIIFGAMYDDTNPDTATITVIATGLDARSKEMVKTPDFLKHHTPSPTTTLRPGIKPELNINRPTYTPGTNYTGPSQPTQSSYTVPSSFNTDPNRRPVSQPGNAPANTNTDPSGNKIPEFLQKNRHNK